jgi:hypothetical protein
MKNKIEETDEEIACHQQQPRGGVIKKERKKRLFSI